MRNLAIQHPLLIHQRRNPLMQPRNLGVLLLDSRTSRVPAHGNPLGAPSRRHEKFADGLQNRGRNGLRLQKAHDFLSNVVVVTATMVVILVQLSRRHDGRRIRGEILHAARGRRLRGALALRRLRAPDVRRPAGRRRERLRLLKRHRFRALGSAAALCLGEERPGDGFGRGSENILLRPRSGAVLCMGEERASHRLGRTGEHLLFAVWRSAVDVVRMFTEEPLDAPIRHGGKLPLVIGIQLVVVIVKCVVKLALQATARPGSKRLIAPVPSINGLPLPLVPPRRAPGLQLRRTHDRLTPHTLRPVIVTPVSPVFRLRKAGIAAPPAEDLEAIVREPRLRQGGPRLGRGGGIGCLAGEADLAEPRLLEEEEEAAAFVGREAADPEAFALVRGVAGDVARDGSCAGRTVAYELRDEYDT